MISGFDSPRLKRSWLDPIQDLYSTASHLACNRGRKKGPDLGGLAGALVQGRIRNERPDPASLTARTGHRFHGIGAFLLRGAVSLPDFPID